MGLRKYDTVSGEVWTESWTGASSRRFKYKGSHGYVDTGFARQFVSHYVRARHYSSAQGMWTSVDPLWPGELAYGYVGNRVTVGVDPSGRQTGLPIPPCPSLADDINKIQPGTKPYNQVQECMKNQGFTLKYDDSRVRKVIENMRRQVAAGSLSDMTMQTGMVTFCTTPSPILAMGSDRIA